MGLDVGDRTIGVAISDSLLMTAQGKSTIQRSGFEAEARHLRGLVKEYDVHEIVVGNPLHMDGRSSGDKIMKFGRDSVKAQITNSLLGRTSNQRSAGKSGMSSIARTEETWIKLQRCSFFKAI